MKLLKLLPILALIGSFAMLESCDPVSVSGPDTTLTPQLPTTAFDYKGIAFPAHFGLEGQLIRKEELNNHVATLGRVLFYDTRLSINNTISCGSCHKQSLGFADGEKVSMGFRGAHTSRNSMSIANPAMSGQLFWDSRVSGVRNLVLEPVQNHIEMGMEDLDLLETKLQNTSFYPALFEQAFGSPEVTSDRIAEGMSQFLRAMVSMDSRFDHEQASAFQNFTAKEELGRQLFFSERAQCSGCHGGINFGNIPNNNDLFIATDLLVNSSGISHEEVFSSDLAFSVNSASSEYGGEDTKGTTNIGLDLTSVDPGLGDGNFKIPSLRNIAVTGPYMHDGRFESLSEVMDFYSEGVQAHPHLDDKFRDENGHARGLNLSTLEKEALIAFLETLTDDTFMRDEKFSDPFRR
ncbi:MAG: cytochrome c peroxidase [Bacteroidota bacterium]